MLIVNREEYSKSDFDLRLQAYEEMEQFQEAAGNRFALCLKDPFDIITLVFFLKEKKSSVLLIHEDTPKERLLKWRSVQIVSEFYMEKIAILRN